MNNTVTREQDDTKKTDEAQPFFARYIEEPRAIDSDEKTAKPKDAY